MRLREWIRRRPFFIDAAGDKVYKGDWVALYGRLDWDGYFVDQPCDTYTHGRIVDTQVTKVLTVYTFEALNKSVWMASDSILTARGPL